MKSKSVISSCLNSILFLLILVIFQNCASFKERGIKELESSKWKVAKSDKGDDPSWIIYTRKITGTNFLEYKIQGEMKSSPEACISTFKEDIHKQATDLKNKKYPIYEIVQESEDSLLTYVIHNEPFPLRDTEMSVKYLFFNKKDGTTGVRWKEAWNEGSVPPTTKRLSRVETFRGSWYFSPISNTNCKGENTVKFDPKKMPMWLVEPMVFKFLKDGLKDIREKTARS